MNYKKITKEEFIKAHKPVEDFEQIWNDTYRLVRRVYGDTKGVSKSYLTASYLLNWKSQGLFLMGENAFEKDFEGTRKDRFKIETAERLKRFAEVNKPFKFILQDFLDDKITYEQLKEKLQSYKETQEKYLAQKDGSK